MAKKLCSQTPRCYRNLPIEHRFRIWQSQGTTPQDTRACQHQNRGPAGNRIRRSDKVPGGRDPQLNRTLEANFVLDVSVLEPWERAIFHWKLCIRDRERQIGGKVPDRPVWLFFGFLVGST